MFKVKYTVKAFDKTNPASVNRSRKFAVEACVETTLKLLTSHHRKNQIINII